MYQYHKDRPTPHLFHDIVKGNMWDTRPLNIFGFNRTVGTSFETLWDDGRSEEHTSELQSRLHLVCRLLLGAHV